MEKEIELEQEAIVVYSGGGAVNSVNGYTGDVVLTTSDLENTSDYQTGTEVESAISTAIAGKQDTLTAGNNITISNNTISATDTTYSAGTGLTLDGTQFSVDTSTIATQQDVSDEATARENADINLQGQIDAISSASDVTDIVGTYAALQAYDTTHLKDNDIIKVLQDESQNDETTYYRWSTSTQTFTLIGEEGPYYTKSQTDTLLQAKQDNLTAGSNITIGSDNTISATDTTYTAGTNVSISSGNVISATDTTYSNFTGTDGTSAGEAGLVPAPATTDAGKFLKADGTWDTAGGGGGITELTSADYNWPTNNPDGVAAWNLTDGYYKSASTVKIYASSTRALSTSASKKLLISSTSSAKTIYSFGGNGSLEATVTVIDNGSETSHYTYKNPDIVQTTGSSTTDVMSQDAITNAIKAISQSGAGAPTASTVGTVGQLYQDTTNGDLYICTDATNPYVWVEVGAGSGSGDTVYSTKTTSNSSAGGAVYIGDKDSNQVVQLDPTTTDNHYKYFWALPQANNLLPSDNSVNILGKQSNDDNCITIGGRLEAEWLSYSVVIGPNANTNKSYTTLIGASASSGVAGGRVTGVGYSVSPLAEYSTAIGNSSIVQITAMHSVALGDHAIATRPGEVNIGTGNDNSGYNSTKYRVIGGVHDGQELTDAATVAQGNTLATSAPTTSTVGVLGQLYTDTTNMHTYQCTAISGDTYTWTQRW